MGVLLLMLNRLQGWLQGCSVSKSSSSIDSGIAATILYSFDFFVSVGITMGGQGCAYVSGREIFGTVVHGKASTVSAYIS